MKSPGSPYEVRCPRCDVSFPIETRRCLHCGGPTGEVEGTAVFETLVQSSAASAEEFPGPIEEIPDRDERVLEASDEPSSIGRSLIRSLGGLVWVVVLIGFTLARNCGGE